MKTHAIIVLPDGTTWSTLNGCSICVVSDEQFKDLCEDRIDANDITPISEIGMHDFTGVN